MKTFKIIMIAGVAALAAACAKNEVSSIQPSGKAPVSLTVAIPEAVKGTIDGDGAGIHANQCRLQILWGDILYYDETVQVTDKKAAFNDILLDRGQKYDFLFWADNKEGAYYVTDNLKKVTLAKDYVGGDDARDAFFANALQKDYKEMADTTITLYRPFGQLNVITTDAPRLYAQLPDKSKFLEVLPDSVTVNVSGVANEFNVYTKASSGSVAFQTSVPVYTASWKHETGDLNTMSMDYFFASAADADLVTVDFTYFNNTTKLKPVTYNWTNIPLRRNFRTNVQGELLTVKCPNVKVVVNPDWYGEFQLDE